MESEFEVCVLWRCLRDGGVWFGRECEWDFDCDRDRDLCIGVCVCCVIGFDCV